ncbi:PIG-L family deacetylase [Erythrobacter sp. HL-111]|uniref:PIG-L family deacetylase n=1 Tax=Erythrobacter sp. HL-111 TaxID=1798193 RepID=UPI0006DAE3FB|nr:PIG-L family deacetylase [Erythrobacter sp. HL-111]KPP94795.1 MAG: putative LmbE-like protein [Erythrobacteraceae bacterium HL-111]SDS85544.1 GlcNAc-PI de-N-acetylase [Erythrobacter sp. HL-111]
MGKAWGAAATLLAGMAVWTGTAGAQEDRPRPGPRDPLEARSILVVLAHPDDELVVAPALAAAVREGVRVRILYATSGDAGPGVSEFEPGEALGRVRRQEARCAGDALGAEIRFLGGIADGTLTERPRAEGSPARRFMDLFTSAFLETVPDTVITWGPEGGYGHGDHRMVSALVTEALQTLPAGDRPALLYPIIVNAPLPAPLIEQGWSPAASDLASVRVAYDEADLAAADAAARCHATQFDEATRAMIAPGFHAAVWKGEVSFRNAF